MIKKTLLSIGIIGLGIINFSSAYYDQIFVLDYPTEIQDNQGNNFEFKDYGNFLLNNQYKVFSVYATGTQNNKFLWNVFWNTEGYLYFIASCEGTSSPCSNTQNKSVNEFIKIQGKPQYFGLCDDTNTINSQYGPCNPSQFDKNQASSFYSDTYSNPDELRVFGTDDLSQFNFCFHYDSLGKYACFYISYFWNLENSLGFVENPFYSQLGNSTLLNSVSCSPWGCPSGSNETKPKPNYVCPTFGQLLQQQNFNTGLCYNTTLRIQNGQLKTIPQKNILEAFTDYEEFTNYRSIYKNKCDTIQGITEECESTFTGEIEKYIIIANAEETGINKKILRNNCNIALNYDLNTTTCVASGYTPEQPTEDDLIERIVNGNYTTINDIYVPGSGNILNRLLEDGETREKKANRDILGNFTQLIGKITSIFHERKGVNGIIPEYILWLIFVSLFLTVILKK